MRHRILLSAASLAAASLIAMPAYAGLIVTTAQGSTGTLIVNNACQGQVDGPATQLVGCLQNSHTTSAFFDSDGENIEFSSGGQAVVVAQDGFFDYLKISLESPFTLDTMILNINSNTVCVDCIQFSTSDGDLSGFFDLDDKGQNFFTLEMSPSVDWIAFQVTGQYVEDSKQWRLELGEGEVPDPDPPPAIPEPGTLAVFGAGLAGWWALNRRRKTKV